MHTVRELIEGRPALSVSADATVMEAVRLMTERNIGAVIVMRDGEMVGIFSERDVMRRVVAGGRSPGLTKVHEVMTGHPQTVTTDHSIDDCIFMMREHGFRHVPVIDKGKVAGLISLRDLMVGRVRAEAGSS